MQQTKIIKLEDNFDVEVEVSNTQAQEISDNTTVDSSIDKLEEMLSKVMKPISNTYRELNKDMNIESVKVAVGIKIGVEGNFILAKSNASANIQVELTFKPAKSKENA